MLTQKIHLQGILMTAQFTLMAMPRWDAVKEMPFLLNWTGVFHTKKLIVNFNKIGIFYTIIVQIKLWNQGFCIYIRFAFSSGPNNCVVLNKHDGWYFFSTFTGEN